MYNQIDSDGKITQLDQKLNIPIINFTVDNRSIIDKFSSSNKDLICPCGRSTFIKGFSIDRYISIGFRCRICNEVTVTPPLPNGDIIPTGSITVAFPDRDLIFSESLINPAKIFFIGENTLKRQQEIYLDIANYRNLDPLTFESVLDQVRQDYSELTCGHDKTHLKSAASFLKQSNLPFGKYPLAWALEYLKLIDSMPLSELNKNANMLASIRFVISFRQTVCRWRRHPMFINYANTYKHINGFHHNIAQLDAATMLLERGHILNFLDQRQEAVRAADMFFNFSDIGKFFLEVKTPEILQWANTKILDEQLLKNKINDIIKKCQISSEKKGILVIGSSRQKDFRQIEDCVRGAVSQVGRNARGLSAVILMQQRPIYVTTKIGINIIPSEIGSDVTTIINEMFDGRNPVSLDSASL